MMPRRLQTSGRESRGFTLIELLVVIAIIGLMVAILLPALSKARESATAIQCATQVRQLYIGAMGYIQDNNDSFTSRFFHKGTKPPEDVTPGFAEYVGAGQPGIRDTIFTCPTLQKNWRTEHWNRNPTYTSNQFMNWTFDFETSKHKLTEVSKPGSTVYIFDGFPLWVEGKSYFYTDVMHTTGAPKLVLPHNGANNTLFLDGHAAPMQREAYAAANTTTFWSGD